LEALSWRPPYVAGATDFRAYDVIGAIGAGQRCGAAIQVATAHHSLNASNMSNQNNEGEFLHV
jgi:hypothetical protein